MALRDLLVKFGIEVEGGQQLLQTDAAIRKTILSAERLGNTFKRLGSYLVIGLVIDRVKDFIESQIQQADALKHNAERLGITSDELQKYEYVAGLMNVSVKETTIAMRFFNRAVGEASLGTKGAVKTFQQLGINVKDADGNVRPTSDLLFEFADRLHKIPSQAQRTAIAMRTLGRNGSQFLTVFQGGSKALKDAFKDVDDLGGGFNDRFIEMAHETDVSMKRLKIAMRSVFVAVATELLPVFKKWIERGIQTAKTLIYLAVHTYGFRTALLALASGTVLFALKRLMGLFNPFKASIKDVMLALLSNAPLVAFVALITTLYLAFDDFYTFLKGGDSLIGDFFNTLGGAGSAKKFRDEIVEAFNKVKDALWPLRDGMKDFAISMLRAFKDSLPFIIKWGTTFGTVVVGALDAAISGISELIQAFKVLEQVFRIGGKPGEALDKLLKDNENLFKRLDAYSNFNNTVANAFTPPKSPPVNAAAPYSGLPAPPIPGDLSALPYAGLPPPPHPGVHFLINIENNVSGGGDSETARQVGHATKKAVKDGVTKARDTWNATNAGMPLTGQ